MAELLWEILTEEIPARMQEDAAQRWKVLASQKLEAASLSFSHLQVFVTPRRLTLWVDGLPLSQPAWEEERKGPRVDAPSGAQEGFFRSVGLSPEDCLQETTSKGTFWMARIQHPEKRTCDVLPALLENMLETFTWPKSMRWSTGTKTWVRPIQSMCCLFDEKICPVVFDRDGLHILSDALTQGHRFLSKGTFEVRSFEAYRQKLHDSGVYLDHVKRREVIAQHVKTIAQEKQCTVIAEDLDMMDASSLINEVTGLVEFPVGFCGQIDQRFLSLPEEVLMTSMRVHQRYFPLRDIKTGKMASSFVVVANHHGQEGGQKIISGNEAVLRARLSDASFFWETDLKKSLVDHRESLKNRLFFEGLGSLWDKGERLKKLAQKFFPENEMLAEAAMLAKADLATHMVGEFPELQGIMGMHYAKAQGRHHEIAVAIRDHYLLPQSLSLSETGLFLGLLDRLDTLYGFFALGKMPKGSKDPLALRRAATGLVHLMLGHSEHLMLEDMIIYAGDLYQNQGFLRGITQDVKQNLSDFLKDRLRHIWREAGKSLDVLEAVFHDVSLSAFESQKIWQKAEGLEEFLTTDSGKDFLMLAHRIRRFLHIEERKGSLPQREVQPDLLVVVEEKELWSAFTALEAPYTYESFAHLKPRVDAFFAQVTVNDPDQKVRDNRLCLLKKIDDVIGSWGDFSQIEERHRVHGT